MAVEPRITNLEGLRAEEEHLRSALEAGEIGTWDWDLATGRMKWSAQMYRNLGLSPEPCEDLYGALIAAIDPADRQRCDAAFGEFRSRAGPLRVEVRIASPAEPRWVVFLGNVAADCDGRPCRMLGITIDSTRRRRTEAAAAAALRDSESRLRELNEQLEQRAEERARQLAASRAQMQAIFDNSPDWLTLFRAAPDGRFIYEDLNRATEHAYGLSYEQVVGRTVEEILGPEQAELPLRLMRTCAETGENQRYTARRTLAGATRTIDVMFVRVPEGRSGERFIMATARDITEREAIEERLRQSQKMEAVGQLTGGVAHDFNNLLTAIFGNLELLEGSVPPGSAGANHIAAATRAAEHGARLTEQLLAFSRQQHLQPRPVDPNAIIAGMRDLLARTIGPTIRVHTVLAAGVWHALVDPTQIEVGILNLAINARDAMPVGGTLTITTCNLPGGSDQTPAEVGARDTIRVSVSDTGTGMSDEVARAAIEPFFTTKEPGKGSGLGLSQVYGTVRQSNGALQIESRLGAGTTVHLYLPKADGPEVLRGDDGGHPQRGQRGGRILVVDDDPAVREITVELLRQSGYGVTAVHSGQAGLDALGRGEVYDLLVVDLAMPGLSGAEFVRRARDKWPALQALYVTGYTESPLTACGEDHVLKKPFRLAELRREVELALRQGRHAAGHNVLAMPRRP